MVRMGRESNRLAVAAALWLFVVWIPIASSARNLRTGGHIDALELLRRLNKPPPKSIQSPDGDIIDCILINQQPAFDHPLLKNHVIQMRPGSEKEEKIEKSQMVMTQLWHTMNEACPDGTVPIRRTKEEDLLRASSLQHIGKKHTTIPSSSYDTISANHEYAAVLLGKGEYFGAKATINVWKPQVEQRDEFSLSQLWINGGSYDQNNLNTIEAGWQVNPSLYGDSNTRFFIFWTNDTYQSGCYNLECPGFVQVSTKIAVGATIAPLSTYGGSQYDITLHVWKDIAGGKWWLKFGEETVGYWPSSLFTTLADAANDIVFGGEIINLATNGHSSTDMGSGHFPEEGNGKASYFKNIKTVDSKNTLIDPPDSLTFSITNPNCYNVKNGKSPDLGSYFYYGGPGNNPNCP